MVLGMIAVLLAVVGFVIVNNAVHKLDSDLHCIGDAQTSAQVNACGK